VFDRRRGLRGTGGRKSRCPVTTVGNRCNAGDLEGKGEVPLRVRGGFPSFSSGTSEVSVGPTPESAGDSSSPFPSFSLSRFACRLARRDCLFAVGLMTLPNMMLYLSICTFGISTVRKGPGGSAFSSSTGFIGNRFGRSLFSSAVSCTGTYIADGAVCDLLACGLRIDRFRSDMVFPRARTFSEGGDGKLR
jgi:hypothetical protein